MSNTYLLLVTLLTLFACCAHAWNPTIDPWDSRAKGHSSPGLKLALVRYSYTNCSIELDQNHPRGDRGDKQKYCLNWEFPFNSFAFEYPRMSRNGDDGSRDGNHWLQLRGCMVSLYRHKNCKGRLERRKQWRWNRCADVSLRKQRGGELTLPL